MDVIKFGLNFWNSQILYLSKFQRVQKKVQAELDQVVGNQRQPTLDDRKK